jgi:hypothetical protein
LRRMLPVLCTHRCAAVSYDSWCVSRVPFRLSLFRGPVFGVHYKLELSLERIEKAPPLTEMFF